MSFIRFRFRFLPLARLMVWGLVVSLLGLIGPANAADSRATETDPSLGTVGGWVGINSTTQGTPISRGGIEVSFYAQNDAGTWVERSSAFTNTGGNYTAALEPGDYKVYFHYDKEPAVESSWYDGPATGGFVDDGTPYVQKATVLKVVAGKSITRVSAGLEDALAPAPAPGRISGVVAFIPEAGDTGPNYYEDFEATAYRKEASGQWQPVASQRTNANGAYSLELDPGTYKIFFHDDKNEFVITGFYAGSPAGNSTKTTPKLADGSAIVLGAGQHIEGVSTMVLGENTIANPEFGGLDGKLIGDRGPVGAGFVDIYRSDDPDSDPLTTVALSTPANDPDHEAGTWRVRLAEGYYYLRFRGGDFTAQWHADSFDRLRARGVSVESGPGSTHIDTHVNSQPGMNFSGTLTNPDGSPAAGIRGWMSMSPGPGNEDFWQGVGAVRTAADGSYTFKVYANRSYRFYFDAGTWDGRNHITWYQAGGTRAEAKTVEVGDGPVSGIDMVLSPPGMWGEVSGKLTIPPGDDPADYTVQLQADEEDPIVDRPSAKLAADGSYQIKDVPAGNYRMVIFGRTASTIYSDTPDDYSSATIIHVGRGQTVPIDFTLPIRADLGVQPDRDTWTNLDVFEAQLWRLNESGEYVPVDREQTVGIFVEEQPFWRDRIVGDYKLSLTWNGVTHWYAGEGNGWVDSIEKASPIDLQDDTMLTLSSPNQAVASTG